MRELLSSIDPDALAIQRMDSESGGVCILQHEEQAARTKDLRVDQTAIARMAWEGPPPDLDLLIQANYSTAHFSGYNISYGELFSRRMELAYQTL